MANILKHQLVILSYEQALYNTHSFRIGKATDLATNGYSEAQIAMLGENGNKMPIKIYCVDRWRLHATHFHDPVTILHFYLARYSVHSFNSLDTLPVSTISAHFGPKITIYNIGYHTVFYAFIQDISRYAFYAPVVHVHLLLCDIIITPLTTHHIHAHRIVTSVCMCVHLYNMHCTQRTVIYEFMDNHYLNTKFGLMESMMKDA